MLKQQVKYQKIIKKKHDTGRNNNAKTQKTRARKITHTMSKCNKTCKTKGNKVGKKVSAKT